MAHLLLDLKANKYMNHTFFRHHLYVYDEYMVYRSRGIFKVNEATISYNHVSQIDLTKGIFFAHLKLINTGGVDDIEIRYVWKGPAKKAKKIIDQKIHATHTKSSGHHDKREHKPLHTIEKSIHRLHELLSRGHISKREFKKRKKRLLKDNL